MPEHIEDDRVDRQASFRAIGVAAASYFAPTFVLGWVLGPIRELVFVPRCGRTSATALEAVLMAGATYWEARRVSYRLGKRSTRAKRYVVGAIAFAMILPLELLGARFVRRMSFRDYLSSLATPSGAIGVSMFAWYALAPGVIGGLHSNEHG